MYQEELNMWNAKIAEVSQVLSQKKTPPCTYLNKKSKRPTFNLTMNHNIRTLIVKKYRIKKTWQIWTN